MVRFTQLCLTTEFRHTLVDQMCQVRPKELVLGLSGKNCISEVISEDMKS